ncbi:MAG: hypothetical protein A2X49_13465 [Lentisphaerae bacterium GWF2_52_8]|nr:MAG: hypothetical protein A2X49_13465 [Lentisphaerae bacterium GWF2_52_8]
MKLGLIIIAISTFLTCFLPSGICADQSTKKISAISEIIELYLADKPGNAEEKALTKTDDFAKEPDSANDPAFLILDMLAGNTSVSTQQIGLATEKKPELWAIASIAFFVRKLATEKKPDSFDLENCLQNYLVTIPSVSIPEVTKWKAKVEQWSKWLEGDCAPVEGLEPLILRKSTRLEKPEDALSDDIESITPEAFAKNRAAFASRPRPPGLEFDQAKCKKYFDSLVQDDLKQIERRRYKYISEIKENLVRILERNPYTGAIKLQNGSTINGTIAMANEATAIVRVGNAKGKAYKWKELHIELFIAMANHYAEQRLSVNIANVSAKERQLHAAQDYLHLALLCDWYGRYEESLSYAVKTIKTCPDLKAETTRVILGK